MAKSNKKQQISEDKLIDWLAICLWEIYKLNKQKNGSTKKL